MHTVLFCVGVYLGWMEGEISEGVPAVDLHGVEYSQQLVGLSITQSNCLYNYRQWNNIGFDTVSTTMSCSYCINVVTVSTVAM